MTDLGEAKGDDHEKVRDQVESTAVTGGSSVQDQGVTKQQQKNTSGC